MQSRRRFLLDSKVPFLGSIEPTHKYVGVFLPIFFLLFALFLFCALWSSSFLRLQIPIRCNNSYWQRFKTRCCLPSPTGSRLSFNMPPSCDCHSPPARASFTVRLSKEFSKSSLLFPALSLCLRLSPPLSFHDF